MRKVDLIVIHCSATREGQVITAADIDRMHRQRGFDRIGYHRFIRLDGTVERGRNDDAAGAHVRNNNLYSIGICYAGGLGKDGKPKDTRTQAQLAAMKALVIEYRRKYPHARIAGHRDLSPDANRSGKVDKWEWMKACPCFSVEEWLIEVGL